MNRIEGKYYKTLNGGKSQNVCAWCGFHKVCLTTKNLKSRDCLKKNCDALVRFDDHPYWKQRMDRKLRAKGLVK